MGVTARARRTGAPRESHGLARPEGTSHHLRCTLVVLQERVSTGLYCGPLKVLRCGADATPHPHPHPRCPAHSCCCATPRPCPLPPAV